MSLRCDECGSYDVKREHVYGLLIEECGLCGHLQGDPGAVVQVEEIREAEGFGVAPELIGLMNALEAATGLAVDRSLSTAAGHTAAPAIYFTLARQPLELLDRLARSLLMASRRTSTLWILEVVHQQRLCFVLRPRVPGDLRSLTVDLALLRDALRRDQRLDWWQIADESRRGKGVG